MAASGEEVHYLDGKWVSRNDMKISCLDLTVLRGYGVFDFLRTYNKKPFLLRDHVDRFFKSAEALELKVPKTVEEIEEIIQEGCRRSPHDELYIKIVLTGGVSSDGITPENSTLFCLFLKAGTWPPEFVTKGIALQTITFERPIPKAKSLNYMLAVAALQKAKKAGFQDVLYISYDGNVLEGTTVNFFGVKNGKLYTSEEGILYGCTRKFILELAKSNIEVIIGTIPKSFLESMDEAFISSTTREIHPVVRIDQIIVGNGEVGPITKKLIERFAEAKAAH